MNQREKNIVKTAIQPNSRPWLTSHRLHTRINIKRSIKGITEKYTLKDIIEVFPLPPANLVKKLNL